MRDKYKRQQAIINGATENQIVNQLMQNNYNDLYQLLVKSDSDIEIFQDTFLNMTRTYYPSINFMNEFCRQFRNIKLEYSEKDNEYSYHISSLNALLEQTQADKESEL